LGSDPPSSWQHAAPACSNKLNRVKKLEFLYKKIAFKDTVKMALVAPKWYHGQPQANIPYTFLYSNKKANFFVNYITRKTIGEGEGDAAGHLK
jgi:hypothetical protein